jgi:hypothetical protein
VPSGSERYGAMDLFSMSSNGLNPPIAIEDPIEIRSLKSSTESLREIASINDISWVDTFRRTLKLPIASYVDYNG